MSDTPGFKLPDEIIEQIRAEFAKTGNKTAVARNLGISRNSSIKYCRSNEPQEARGGVDDIVAKVLAAIGHKSPVEPPRAAESRTVELKGYRRVAVLADSHHPFHDARGLNAAFDFLHDWKPDLLIFNGDTIDFHSISRFDKCPSRVHHLQDELDSFGPTRDRAEKLGCDIDWIDGNHEYRLVRTVSENPGLYGLRNLSIPELLKFPKRWRYHANQSHLRIGRLLVHHGDMKGRGCSGKYPAGMMLNKIRTTNLFGHLHREDVFNQSEYSGEVTSSYASACLCDPKKIDYLTNPNWHYGFPIVEIDSRGQEHVTNKRITDGRLYHEGTEYLGKS